MKHLKHFIIWLCCPIFFFIIITPAYSQQSAIKVTILGTAGPEYFPDRSGISTLIEANGQKFLFDVGHGTNEQLYKSRINPKDINRIFLTHLHSDHYNGLADVWLTPWFLLGRTNGIELWGPDGTSEMVQGMRQMFAHDMNKRVDKYNLLKNLAITIHPLKDGVIYNQDGIKITAFPVEHGDGNPAFGFRFDYAGHSVVMSGDTTYHQNVVKYGTGANLLIHNVVAYNDQLSKLPEMKEVMKKLATPEQAAKVFLETKPKMALYSHIVTKGLGTKQGDKIIMERTRKAGYTGPLIMGIDRMRILIGNEIKILPPQSLANLPPLDSKEQIFP